jgi:hypothetical protein
MADEWIGNDSMNQGTGGYMRTWKTVKSCYEPALYVVLGYLLLTNFRQLEDGHWMALLPVAVQGTVIASVALRVRWAYVIVRVWAAISILAGACLWMAILLAGGKMIEPTSVILFRTLGLIVGVFFFTYAKTSLVRTDPEEATNSSPSI